MRKVVLLIVILATGAATVFLLASIAAASPLPQLALTGIEPDTLVSQAGGTLSIYGSGFTTATIARLVGFGMLDTTYVNNTALLAVVPPSAPAGAYDLQVSEDSISVTLPSALTIVAATPIPGPTPLPTPKPTPVPGRPNLTILNYSIEPARVVVGREFIVTIEIYNNGSRAGENTMVTFPGGTFVPVGETGHLLWQLHINHTAVVTQQMRAPSGLASGSYNLQVNLSANDWEGNHYEYPQTVAVEVIGIGHGRPQLVIEAARTEPAILGPGDTFSLTLCLANRGDRTATDVLISAASGDLAAPAGGSNVVAVEPVGLNRTVTVTLPLVLSEVTQAGRLNLEIALDYSDYDGGSYAARQSVGLEVSTAMTDRPQLIIAGYRTTPRTLAPGDAFTLTLEVSNVGGGEARRLTLTLGDEGGSGMDPFAPLHSSNVKFVPHLAAEDTVEVTQQLVVDGGADSGAYSLPVALAFDDARDTRHSDSQLISLLVRRRPHLQIGFYHPVEVATVGVPFELPVEVTNIGRTLVNVSTLEVTSMQLEIQDGSLYLGPLDGGTSGSLEATATAQAGGTAEVLVTVHYLDDFEQPQVVTKTLTVEVENPAEVSAEAGEEAQEQGEGFWDKVLRFLRGLLGLGS
ncbi:MAG: IPT/TIG domain-containing protein [Anaerolineae bacterium]|nr:IPT/TIG domain-containing protein [Anaerolineae bacterium]